MHVPEGTCGDWEVRRVTVTREDTIRFAIQDAGMGRHYRPGTYTQLLYRGRIVMSDTPAEMHDHAEVWRRARGSVLLNGLGLGMILLAVLAKASVTDVTVIEIAPEVIQLVAPTYAGDPRLQIIQADAFTWQPPKGKRYQVVWHDIWRNIAPENLAEMQRLHRKYGRRCDWQGSWSRPLLMDIRRLAAR